MLSQPNHKELGFLGTPALVLFRAASMAIRNPPGWARTRRKPCALNVIRRSIRFAIWRARFALLN